LCYSQSDFGAGIVEDMLYSVLLPLTFCCKNTLCFP